MTELETYTQDAANASASAISAFKTNDLAVFSSIGNASFSEKLRVSQAVTSAIPLSEHLGKPLEIVDFVIHEVELQNEETGDMEIAARTVLITPDGTAYAAISGVILKRIRDLVGILGYPSEWERPVTVQIERVKGNGPNFFYDLRIVATDE